MRLGIGAYLLVTAAVVGVFFVVSPFFESTIDVIAIWNNVMRPLRAAGIVLALVILWMDVRGTSPAGVAGLSARLAFYAAVALAIVFFRASAVGLAESAGYGTDLFALSWTVVNVLYVPIAGAVGWRLLIPYR